MRSESIDESLLARYLRGELSEEEQVHVEDRAFADPEYLAALEATEADVIDSYVRGELTAPQRRAFEQRFLVSPRRLRKVAFARDLARVAAEAKLSEPIPRASAWQSLASMIRGWSPALQFAMAVVLLMCVGGAAWLTVANMSMRSRVAVLEKENGDLQSQGERLRRQLGEEQSRTSDLAARLKEPQVPDNTPASVIATLVLMPGLSRAESQREQLVLNPSAQIARIEIQLEPRDDYARFRAELRTARGEEVLTRGNLSKRRVNSGAVVSFEVPASALAAGQYELALKGILDERSAQDVGYYYFTVQK